MDFIKDNIHDFILLIGIIFISIGCFLYSTIAGFIATGVLLISMAICLIRGGA